MSTLRSADLEAGMILLYSHDSDGSPILDEITSINWPDEPTTVVAVVNVRRHFADGRKADTFFATGIEGDGHVLANDEDVAAILRPYGRVKTFETGSIALPLVFSVAVLAFFLLAVLPGIVMLNSAAAVVR